MSVEAFEAQLDFLDHSGYKVISIEDLTRSLDARQNPPEKAVVLAIDDGWSSFMQVFPILAKRNLPFTLFLPMLSGARVLEIGCGDGGGAGIFSRVFAPGLYHGLDVDPAMLPPALRLARGLADADASALFNRASFYPVLVLAVLVVHLLTRRLG